MKKDYDSEETIAKKVAGSKARYADFKRTIRILMAIWIVLSLFVGTWVVFTYRDALAEVGKTMTTLSFMWRIVFYSAGVAFMSFIVVAIVSIIWDQISYSKDRGIPCDSEGCTCKQSGNETCMYHYNTIQ